jgi:hypothetical protein
MTLHVASHEHWNDRHFPMFILYSTLYTKSRNLRRWPCRGLFLPEWETNLEVSRSRRLFLGPRRGPSVSSLHTSSLHNRPLFLDSGLSRCSLISLEDPCCLGAGNARCVSPAHDVNLLLDPEPSRGALNVLENMDTVSSGSLSTLTRYEFIGSLLHLCGYSTVIRLWISQGGRSRPSAC